MKKLVFFCALAFAFIVAASHVAPAGAQEPVTVKDFQPLPKPGEKVPLGPDHYFIYGFVQAPKLGTAIMKVEIFTTDGRPDTTFVVKGDADMPSMRGAHATGDRNFQISAKEAYLLPIPLVMPGDWEVRFTFEKDDTIVLRGAYLFDL